MIQLLLIIIYWHLVRTNMTENDVIIMGECSRNKVNTLVSAFQVKCTYPKNRPPYRDDTPGSNEQMIEFTRLLGMGVAIIP